MGVSPRIKFFLKQEVATTIRYNLKTGQNHFRKNINIRNI